MRKICFKSNLKTDDSNSGIPLLKRSETSRQQEYLGIFVWIFPQDRLQRLRVLRKSIANPHGFGKNIFSCFREKPLLKWSGTDAIKKFTPSLGIPSLGVYTR